MHQSAQAVRLRGGSVQVRGQRRFVGDNGAGEMDAKKIEEFFLALA